MTTTMIITSVPELRLAVSDVMSQISCDKRLTSEKEYDIRLCLREMLSNSLIYSGCNKIKFVYQLSGDSFCFSVMDHGHGFCPEELPAQPDVYSESGRGIYIVKHLADTVRYNKKGTAVLVRFFY